MAFLPLPEVITFLVRVPSLGARREASAKAYRSAYPLGRSLSWCAFLGRGNLARVAPLSWSAFPSQSVAGVPKGLSSAGETRRGFCGAVGRGCLAPL